MGDAGAGVPAELVGGGDVAVVAGSVGVPFVGVWPGEAACATELLLPTVAVRAAG